MGKRGPKKRTDLDAIWEMRKLIERQGFSRRGASRIVARAKPYTWETLRKAYTELEEAGELPSYPPVSEAHEELVRRKYKLWRETLEDARADLGELSERLRELGALVSGYKSNSVNWLRSEPPSIRSGVAVSS